MARANYTYQIEIMQGRKCIVITDANKGQMSVADDIENVVEEICEKEELKADDCVIVYKCSEETWEGWDASNNHYVLLQAKHWAHAINKYLKMLRTPVC